VSFLAERMQGSGDQKKVKIYTVVLCFSTGEKLVLGRVHGRAQLGGVDFHECRSHRMKMRMKMGMRWRGREGMKEEQREGAAVTEMTPSARAQYRRTGKWRT